MSSRSEKSRRRAAESLAFVGLRERADQPVSSLNLHQLRFLELAKALAGRPEVLLLDEVMAGLNETELAASVEIVRNVRDELGTAILLVEHVMSAVIQLAERAIVLNFGKVLGRGAPGVVMRDPRSSTPISGRRALLEVDRPRSRVPGRGGHRGRRRRGRNRRGGRDRRLERRRKTTLFRAIAGLLPTMRGRSSSTGRT